MIKTEKLLVNGIYKNMDEWHEMRKAWIMFIIEFMTAGIMSKSKKESTDTTEKAWQRSMSVLDN